MYCAGCGNKLDTNQQVCGKCGKPVASAPTAATPRSYPSPAPAPYPSPAPYLAQDRHRVQRHIQSLGYVWIAYACWSLLQVAAVATFMTGMSGIFGNRFLSPMTF